MKRLKVYIVHSNWDYERMWVSRGHDVVASLEQADIVQFTGGADVSPELYGEKNVRSFCDANRDKNEQKIFSWCVENNKPMAGICRGGQFLNVMNGGKLWQHVTNHVGNHHVIDFESGETYECTSTHHQMMRVNRKDAEFVVGVGDSNIADFYQSAAGDILQLGTNGVEDYESDVEVVFYPTTRSLCFQPHPEFGAGECEDYYFLLIERYYGGL